MAAKPQAQAARNEDVGSEFLVFTLGDEEYGIDILKVQETWLCGHRDPTRQCPAHQGRDQRAASSCRSSTCASNLGSVEYNEQTVVIILNLERRVVGIVVDGVSDVLMLNSGQIRRARART